MSESPNGTGVAKSGFAQLPERVTQLSPLARYGIAVGAAAAAMLLRLAMDPIWGVRLPFILAFPAIMLSSWLGGLWPGIVTTLLSAAAAGYFWLDKSMAQPADWLSLLAFLLVGAAISGLNEAWRCGTTRALALERERTTLLRNEREARRLAEEANRIKDHFLAVLSHELRTPLQSVMGYAHLLQTGRLTPEQSIQALEAIERNAQSQARLIESLLDLSRVEAGKLELRLTDLDLSSVVAAAVEVIRPAAEAKRLTLQTMAPQEPVAIVGDEERLQQVVWNLLSNAVKFTPKGGRIEIRVERTEMQANVQVRDSGKGISADFLPHVFDRFTQANQVSERGHGGLGLGLAIVRELVKAHRGTVVAQSGGEGRGSTFIVALPLPAAPTRADMTDMVIAPERGVEDDAGSIMRPT